VEVNDGHQRRLVVLATGGCQGKWLWWSLLIGWESSHGGLSRQVVGGIDEYGAPEASAGHQSRVVGLAWS